MIQLIILLLAPLLMSRICDGQKIDLVCPKSSKLSQVIEYQEDGSGQSSSKFCIFCKKHGCPKLLQYCSFFLKGATNITNVQRNFNGQTSLQRSGISVHLRRNPEDIFEIPNEGNFLLECPKGTSKSGVVTNFYVTLTDSVNSRSFSCLECKNDHFNVSVCLTDYVPQNKARFWSTKSTNPDELCLDETNFSSLSCPSEHGLSLVPCVSQSWGIGSVGLSVVVWLLVLITLIVVFLQFALVIKYEREIKKTNWLLHKK